MLNVAREDWKGEGKEIVVPSTDEDITIHVERYLSIYIYLFTFGTIDMVVI